MTASEMAHKRWKGVPREERRALMRRAAAKATEVRQAKARARRAAAAEAQQPETVEA